MSANAKKKISSPAALRKFIIGLVLVALGVVLWIQWGTAFVVLLKGSIGPLLLFVGIIFVVTANE